MGSAAPPLTPQLGTLPAPSARRPRPPPLAAWPLWCSSAASTRHRLPSGSPTTSPPLPHPLLPHHPTSPVPPLFPPRFPPLVPPPPPLSAPLTVWHAHCRHVGHHVKRRVHGEEVRGVGDVVQPADVQADVPGGHQRRPGHTGGQARAAKGVDGRSGQVPVEFLSGRWEGRDRNGRKRPGVNVPGRRVSGEGAAAIRNDGTALNALL